MSSTAANRVIKNIPAPSAIAATATATTTTSLVRANEMPAVNCTATRENNCYIPVVSINSQARIGKSLNKNKCQSISIWTHAPLHDRTIATATPSLPATMCEYEGKSSLAFYENCCKTTAAIDSSGEIQFTDADRTILVSEVSCSKENVVFSFDTSIAKHSLTTAVSSISISSATTTTTTTTSSSLSPSLTFSSSSTPSICCYSPSRSLNKRNKHFQSTESFTNSLATQNSVNCGEDVCESFRSVFGRNYNQHHHHLQHIQTHRSSAIPIKIIKKKVIPPPVPPKPLHNRQNNNKNNKTKDSWGSESKNYRIVPIEKSHYDPASFRRKIQKFEKQNTLIGKSKNNAAAAAVVVAANSVTTPTTLLSDKCDHDRCELLSCFSLGKNINFNRSTSDGSCCSSSSSRSISNITDEQQECVESHDAASRIANNNIKNNNNNIKVLDREENKPLRKQNVIIDDNNTSAIKSERKTGNSKSPAKRILRYDSFGRLKSIGSNEIISNNVYHTFVSDNRLNHALIHNVTTTKPIKKLIITNDGDNGNGVIKFTKSTSNVPEYVASRCNSNEEILNLPYKSATDSRLKINAEVHYLPVGVSAISDHAPDNDDNEKNNNGNDYNDDAGDDHDDDDDDDYNCDTSQDIGYIDCSSSASGYSNGPDRVDAANAFVSSAVPVNNNHSTKSDLDLSYNLLQKRLLRDATAAAATAAAATNVAIVTDSAAAKEIETPTAPIFKSSSDPTANYAGKISLTTPASAVITVAATATATTNFGFQKSSAESVSSSSYCIPAIKDVFRSLSDVELRKKFSSVSNENNIAYCECNYSNNKSNNLWLSGETIEENYSSPSSEFCLLHTTCCNRSIEQYQISLEDFSNDSVNSNLLHPETDCLSVQSTSSSRSLGYLPVCNNGRTVPLILKRIPPIKSFGYSSVQIDTSNREKEIIMDKKRNTMERFQRLGFGRKSSPNLTQQEKNKKSSEKSERLKELTELLRGNRLSPTPPPVPPPRKLRNLSRSATSSFDKPDKSLDSMLQTAHSDDILLMDHESEINFENLQNSKISESIEKNLNRNPCLFDTLKANSSAANLESLALREKSRSPSSQDNNSISRKFSRPEPRTIVGSSTNKGIPTRSASFSQIDYSSGKYKKSALSSLRDRLRRDKAVESSSPVGSEDRLTLPRRRDDHFISWGHSFEEEKLEPDYIYIPLKEASPNAPSNFNDLEDKTQTDSSQPPYLIPEKDAKIVVEEMNITLSGKEKKKESIENIPDSVEDLTPVTMVNPSKANTITATEYETQKANLATLVEEEIQLESPPDNILQTATTCLIPVPVYECAAQEWRLENPPHEWVEIAHNEVDIQPEPVTSSDSTPDSLYQASSDVPKISFSERNDEETPIDLPEVKKRYSNDDIDIGTEKRTYCDLITASRATISEEKKRLDKSKRRKGMYIDSSDWSENTTNRLSNRGLELDISIANFKATKQSLSEEGNTLDLSSPPTEDTGKTPGSTFSFELNTPDSECNKPAIWTQQSLQRRTSLSCQSSEDKDDGHCSMQKLNKINSYIRTDSISDNESDRTPPPSLRDRMSPSPSLADYDYKRYSKRPLRGPYGQMLEAEMKKPNKKHFEEILEELKDSECFSVRRQRNTHDDTVRNLPQHSNSVRVRKSNTYLPVPFHIRAASTPSQIENVNSVNRGENDKENGKSIDDRHHGREVKRAASETPAPKPIQNKRSSSTGADKHKNDDSRLLQTTRTPSNSGTLLDPSARNGNVAKLLPTPQLLAELLKGSNEPREKMISDTRTHVVQEIFRNEQSYVESLQTVVIKYLKVLKTPEHAGMIDSRTVDEIFFMVPDILEIHEKFLRELQMRLDLWEPQQKVGDAFFETFSKTEVLEVYTSFVNNCNRAKNAIRTTKSSRPSFARFLESTAREHKGKLTLDNLLIKPVQKFPNYEMLFTRLIKHTDTDHPDQKHLQEVLKLVHDILVHINCKEREILENGQREATLRELEGVIEGVTDLIATDRQFLLFDLVSMPSGQGARKERGFFLFNDLLVITSIKRRSGTIRKPNPTICPGSVASTLDTNKYKFLTKVSLDNLEIVKSKDENVRKIMSEIEQLAEDCNKLQKIVEIVTTLKCPHQALEDVVRDLQRDVQRQLSERRSNDAQLNMLELAVNSPSGSQRLLIVFNKAEKRSQWEEAFNEAKQKLAASLEKHPIPEFMTSIPIRKTRAGLQFTCAAPTLSEQKDVWVCNSDGYVGQVCVMSLQPEPNVTSCNGVCNARILCIASVPAYNENENDLQHKPLMPEKVQRDARKTTNNQQLQNEKKKSGTSLRDSDIQLDSNSSSEDSDHEVSSKKERIPSPSLSAMTTAASSSTTLYHHQHQDSNSDDSDCNQSTMWLGTEDGCIHVYNSTDNIRIKKNKIKIQHSSAVYSILYLENRVFISLANGDICVYFRDNGGWNTNLAHYIPIGTVSSPVQKLLNVHGKLWCSIQGIIKVLDIETLQVINQIQISSDSKPITNMAVANNYVWISIQNSAHIKCFHSNSHQLITEVNLAPAVNKMLSNCDEIIRQHKAACLRVTSLLSCKDLVWIGTSAGVLLTIPSQGYEKGSPTIVPTGLPHGHTGHVRFLTYVDTIDANKVCAVGSKENDTSSSTLAEYSKNKSSPNHSKEKSQTINTLIISGGDGYEDFRNSGANSLSEIAGREDSTNHLLIWEA